VHAPARLLELLEPRQLAHEAIKHAHDAGVALPRADELLLAQPYPYPCPYPCPYPPTPTPTPTVLPLSYYS
jgi:hypothetical protein